MFIYREKTRDLQAVSSVVNSLYKDSEKKSAKAAILQGNINDFEETIRSKQTNGPYSDHFCLLVAMSR